MSDNDIATSVGFRLSDGTLVVTRLVQTIDGELIAPDAEMVDGTIRRYNMVRKALLNNEEMDGESYVDMPPLANPVDSTEYRVQVFGDVAVNLGDDIGKFPAKINMFNETTDPLHTVKLMRVQMQGLWLAGQLDKPANGGLANTAQDFADHAAANGGRVDLKRQFPRNTNGGASTAKTEPSTNGNDETPIIMNFDNRKDEFSKYCEAYQGQRVKVRIAKIGNSFKTNQAKSKTWQVFEFIPFYNDEPGKFVAFNLDQYIPAEGDKAWKYNDGGLLQLQQLVPEAGDNVEGDYFVTFLVNPSGNRVYWNATNVELVADSEYTEAALQESAAGEEIPF